MKLDFRKKEDRSLRQCEKCTSHAVQQLAFQTALATLIIVNHHWLRRITIYTQKMKAKRKKKGIIILIFQSAIAEIVRAKRNLQSTR